MSRSSPGRGLPATWRRSGPAGPDSAHPVRRPAPDAALGRRPKPPAPAPPPRQRTKSQKTESSASWLVRLAVLLALLQHHRHVAEAEHAALVGDLEVFGIERAVEQFHPHRRI